MARCHTKVTLRRVTYLGDDIGNDWEYRLRVVPGGGWVRIPEHTLNHGSSEDRNDLLLDGDVGECHTNIRLRFYTWAKEHDLFFDDHNRPTRRTVVYPCPNEFILDITHEVDERFTLFGRETALLTFRYEIVLTCP